MPPQDRFAPLVQESFRVDVVVHEVDAVRRIDTPVRTARRSLGRAAVVEQLLGACAPAGEISMMLPLPPLTVSRSPPGVTMRPSGLQAAARGQCAAVPAEACARAGDR